MKSTALCQTIEIELRFLHIRIKCFLSVLCVDVIPPPLLLTNNLAETPHTVWVLAIQRQRCMILLPIIAPCFPTNIGDELQRTAVPLQRKGRYITKDSDRASGPPTYRTVAFNSPFRRSGANISFINCAVLGFGDPCRSRGAADYLNMVVSQRKPRRDTQ